MKLLEFNYTIEYKKGKENVVVDALSTKDYSAHANTLVTPAWITDIEQSYTSDPYCTSMIHQQVINDQAQPHYSVHSGILRFKGKICIGNNSELNSKII
jgi:hypothetical protein